MGTLGMNIRKRREELGMTQQELADKLGYSSKSTINKIENGTNDITQSKIIAFAKALNATVPELMGWGDSKVKESNNYYLNDDVRELAQELFDNRELKLVMDSSRKLSIKSLIDLKNIIDNMKGEED